MLKIEIPIKKSHRNFWSNNFEKKIGSLFLKIWIKICIGQDEEHAELVKKSGGSETAKFLFKFKKTSFLFQSLKKVAKLNLAMSSNSTRRRQLPRIYIIKFEHYEIWFFFLKYREFRS